jgi:phosphoribosylaminoimidazole-succinocarboxamide synthase
MSTPQLVKIHSGKVRESFRVDPVRRLLVVSDRISCFDHVLATPIPHKGAVLNGISNYWFERTRSIIDNHMIAQIDPQATLAREAVPVRVEMIVRGYLTGSMWRQYREGKRTFSGVELADGMTRHARFPEPLVTPTTKEHADREISPREIVAEGLVDGETYGAMERAARALFEMGTGLLAERGIILVDTKYEFGLLDGGLILIDEIHTPDSSRFWRAEEYTRRPEEVEHLDKEYVRQWLLQNRQDGEIPRELPDSVVAEASRRYREIYELVTRKPFSLPEENIHARIYRNLVGSGIIRDGYVAIVMGSPADREHCEGIRGIIEAYGIMADVRVCSAHKSGEALVTLAEEYNASIEPGAVIAVAGASNGLGGALAANLALPVINCPPFRDRHDMMININSSLMMPSNCPATTVIEPNNAALAALRALNLPRLRQRFRGEIREIKSKLREADRQIRGR